jgi:DNA-binding NarL/FixJ family response regulator
MQEVPNFSEKYIKVIIADDHPLIIKGITEILEKYPRFTIVNTYNNGHTLMQSTSLPDADVLLLDLNMPGKDGLQVLEKIKAMHLKLQILVLTSYFSKQLAEQCHAAGAKGYILKSDNLDKLADTILEVLDGKTVMPNFSEKTEE